MMSIEWCHLWSLVLLSRVRMDSFTKLPMVDVVDVSGLHRMLVDFIGQRSSIVDHCANRKCCTGS